MAQPARKVDELSAQLANAEPLSEFRLAHIARELQQLISRTKSSADAAELYKVLGSAHHRMRKYDLAEAAYVRARNLKYQHRPELGLNLGAALLAGGKVREAVDELVSVADEARDAIRSLVFANLAEAFSLLGLPDDADAAFQEAVDVADLTDPLQLFGLALQAAEIGAERQAFDFYRRYAEMRVGTKAIQSKDLLAALGPEHRSVLDEHPRLKRAVLAGLSRPLPEQLGRAEDEAAAEETFEAMRPFRKRANAAVLGE